MSCRLTSGGECLGVCHGSNSASHPKTRRTAMGIAAHRTCRVKRVEGRRDETRTVKADRSAAQCGKGQRKTRRHEPAGLVTDSRLRLSLQPPRMRGQPLTVSLSDPIGAGAGLAHGSIRPSVRPKTRSHTRTPSVSIVPITTITTRRTGMGPGGALVPCGGAGTPAVNDAGTTGCAMATRSASVCGVSRSNAGNDGKSKKSRDQKGFHTAVLRLDRKQRLAESLRLRQAPRLAGRGGAVSRSYRLQNTRKVARFAAQ